MAADAHIRARSYVVRLGAPAPEIVDRSRQDLHRWLARELAPTKTPPSLDEPRDTIYLSFDEIREEPNLIKRFIVDSEDGEEIDIAIIDLSTNQPELIRDSLYLHLGELAAQLAQRPERVVAFLLPSSEPSRNSLFWDPMDERDRPLHGAILVVDSAGRATWRGGDHRGLRKGFESRYAERQRLLVGPIHDRVRARVLRRLGHYDLVGRPDAACGRYFYDASLAVNEFADLITQKIEKSLVPPRERDDIALAVHAPMSRWMRNSAAMAANRLGMKLVELPENGRAVPNQLRGRRVLLLLDYVNTGSTARSLVRLLLQAKADVVRDAVAALAGFHQRLYAIDEHQLHVHSLHIVDTPTHPRESCIQCKIQYPFNRASELDPDDVLGIRAFDMWHMLLGVHWEQERYGPARTVRFRLQPSLREIFDDYGDWIAYKVELVLRGQGYDSEIVLVAPDEPAVQRLTERLRVRYQDRLVTVALPRKEIDAPRRSSTSRRRWPQGEEPIWYRQLRHAAKSDVDVVMIDEFNGSGTTARGMLRIIEESGANCRLYVPVIDRAPAATLPGIQVASLYKLHAPRPAGSSSRARRSTAQ